MSFLDADPVDRFGLDPRRAWGRVVSVVFGDRIGLAIFLAAICVLALQWRLGIQINDNYAVFNGMTNLMEGHLYVDHLKYYQLQASSRGQTPGFHVRDGHLYASRYGLLFMAAPFAVALHGLAAVADLRVAIAGIWCLLVLALAVQVGTLVGRRRAGVYGGSLLAVVLFSANVWVGTDLEPRMVDMMALHLLGMVAAATTGVLLYRLLRAVEDRTVGVVAGIGVVIASPLGFWALSPKRHAVVTALVVAAMYAFYRSRTAETPRAALRFRLLQYVPVGAISWVYLPDGFLLFLVLAPVDVLTARSNTVRELSMVGGVLFASMVPAFVTNALVTGNPLIPPLFLPGYAGETSVLFEGARGVADVGSPETRSLVGGGGTAVGGDGTGVGGGETTVADGTSTGGGTDSGSGSPVSEAESPFELALRFAESILASFVAVFTDPGRLYHTFVRSGYAVVADTAGSEAVSFSYLESMPVAAALVSIPVAALSRLDEIRYRARAWLASPVGALELLAVAYAGVIAFVYLPYLPGHAQLTVRYLTPTLPIVVYLVVRHTPVREAIRERATTVGYAYGFTVLIGTQLFAAGTVLLDLGIGEIFQFYAVLSLAAGGILAAWTLLRVSGRLEYDAVGAVSLGVAAGMVGVFLLVAAFELFAFADDLALPLSRLISEFLDFV